MRICLTKKEQHAIFRIGGNSLLYQLLFCPILFSFLYQLCHIESLNFKYFNLRSLCDYCKKPINYFCLIPIISYIYLRGKTRCCKRSLKPTYIVGECLSILPGCLLTFSNLQITLVAYILNFLFLLVLSVYDFEHFSIPLHVVIIYIICTLCLCIGHPIKCLIVTAILHCLFYILKQAIGYGDILIFSILSFTLPLQIYLLTLQFTFILAGSITLIIMLIQRRRINKIPLIPYIFLAFILSNFVTSFFNIPIIH